MAVPKISTIFILLALSLSFATVSGQKSGYLVPVDAQSSLNNEFAEPSIFVAILVRNKAHTLPYFLPLLERLDYPKDRLSIWIKSDHNEDETAHLLRRWVKKIEAQEKYHSISLDVIDPPPYKQSDQGDSPVKWSSERFKHVIRLKEEAIKVARKVWADYIWFLDADVFLLNNQTLNLLTKKGLEIAAPLLLSGGLYSNFWGGMKNFYYARTDEYKLILDRKKLGCFPVPLVHSAVLCSLKRKRFPSFTRFNQSIPNDDIILMAMNAQNQNLSMYVCNDAEYGYVMTPLSDEADWSRDLEQLANLRIEIAAYWDSPLKADSDFENFAQKDPYFPSLPFDEVYLINLKRRKDRLDLMNNVLEILGIQYTYVEAVDGNELTQKDIDDLGIRLLSSYRDPYHNRKMTFGEVGCFLSHYRIWQKMVKHHVMIALVLEDDIRFEPYFVYQVQALYEEMANLKLDWDLMYLGRKRAHNADEPLIPGAEYIAQVDYTYWTLGYVINLRGARKLLAAEPLKKLLPVDEFLPIMFDRHPNDTWKSAFPRRNLKAFSAEPLLMYPTHYTGEQGYISDTEDSSLVAEKEKKLRNFVSGEICSLSSPCYNDVNGSAKQEL